MSPNLLGAGEIQDQSFLTCPLMLGEYLPAAPVVSVTPTLHSIQNNYS